MKNFLEILCAEAAEVDARIAECEAFAMRLPGLRKKKQSIEALAAAYVDQEVDGHGEEAPLAETLAEMDAEDALAAVAESDTDAAPVAPVVLHSKVAVTENEEPRAADPAELFQPARMSAVHGKGAVNGAKASLQKQQTLAEAAGIKAMVLPAQIVGPRGAPLDCSELQSGIVAVLLKAFPNILGDVVLRDKSYQLTSKKVTSGSQNMISYEIRDLNNKLASRGVEIVHTRGIGYSIKATA